MKKQSARKQSAKKISFTSAVSLIIPLLFLILTPLPLQAVENTSEAFTFIHLTDPHIGSGAGNKYSPAVIDDILQNYPTIAFMVNTGDISELGRPEEYQAYRQLISAFTAPCYHTPGNHESRWIDAGKGYFKEYFGACYTSWNYGGIHFVTLDSSIAKGQNGHLDKQMLSWLQKDLRTVSKTTPVILFSHHPLFFDEGKTEANFTDNDFDLWSILKGYNVPAIFTGHGHRNDMWKVNGITVIMTKAAMESGYAIVEVDPDQQELTVYNKLVGITDPAIEPLSVLTKIPLNTADPRTIKITDPAPDKNVNSSFLLQARLENWTEPPRQVEYKLEDNRWKPLDLSGSIYQKTVDLSNVDDGLRVITVRAVDNQGHNYIDKVRFRLLQNPQIKLNWEASTDGGIQGTPALGSKYVYVGDNSGKVYALQQATGHKVWEAKTQGAILGSPVLVNGVLYVGSADGKLYAFNPTNGSKLWEYQTGGAILAQPLVADGKVFCGSSDYNFYALQAETGKLLWKFATGSTIMSSAAYGSDTVFFGSWDQKFYAVDTQTGLEKWRQEIGSQVYYAPAASNPLFYQQKVFISTPGGKVYAYDAATGKQLWEVSASSGLSSPIMYNDALVYSTLSGSLYALDPETGENVWQTETALANFGASAVKHGGAVLLNSLQAKIASFNTGKTPLNWNIKLGDQYLLANSATKDEMVFVGTMEGKLYALSAPPGESPEPFPLLTAYRDTGSYWARRDLNQVFKLGLITGYGDGTYRPELPVTRAELAGILSRYLEYENPSPSFENPFVDTQEHWAVNAITAMAEKNITGGYGDSKGKLYFKPDNPAKRGETAVMLAKALGIDKPSAGFQTKYADIDNHWAKETIIALEEKGLLGGYNEDGKTLFKPENTINRGEVGVIMVRMVNMAHK